MNILESGILGVVEGLTEFLPISSTGHLILVGRFLKLQDSNATKAFQVVIQSGAILAVIWHYRKLLFDLLRGVFKRQLAEQELLLNLIIAFMPAAVLGLMFHRLIKEYLFGPNPVIYAMVLGGLAILFIEKQYSEKGGDTPLTKKQALVIGLSQCLALWPGVSRSMSTILGGRMAGLNAAAAARFSFLLAIPTLLAATGLDLIQHRLELFADDGAWQLLIVGMLSSYIVALLVIRGFLAFLSRRSLEIFGWYRIVVGLVLFYLFY